MGYKNVCLNCKRVESLGTDYSFFRTGDCPECSSPMHFVSHKFRPPKLADARSWEVVAFLIERDFCFQTIRDENGAAVNYPTTMRDAKEFVIRHSFEPSFRNTRRKHDLERQIVDLESREQNGDRDKMIRDLRNQLDNL